MGAHLWADRLPREGSAACRACRSAAEGPVEDPGGAGQRPTEPQGPSPGAAGQEVPGVQSPDEPRDSLSSSAKDTPRARVVRHRLGASPPARFTALSPGPLSPVARDAGVRGGFQGHAGVRGSALAPALLRPPPEARAPAAGGRGWRLSPSDPAAEEGRAARGRRRVRQASESGGAPYVRRLLKEEGGRVHHEYRIGVRRKEWGSLTARA